MTSQVNPPKDPYVSRKPGPDGLIEYSAEDNQVWHDLIERQDKVVPGYACDEFLDGLKLINFKRDEVPQLKDVNEVLLDTTGWQVHPVTALISHDKFFQLLSECKFPAATFVRRREEFDYLQEPDIFHEFYGHCPMLTCQPFADFSQKYGELAKGLTHKQMIKLLRLYWFTVEFGLIQTSQGLRAYGGGILSSPEETVYSLESDKPERKKLDILTALRTPYRIDILQTVYFFIDGYEQLYQLLDTDLVALSNQAIALGDFDPTYPPKEK